jgi:hypothetical protein
MLDRVAERVAAGQLTLDAAGELVGAAARRGAVAGPDAARALDTRVSPSNQERCRSPERGRGWRP